MLNVAILSLISIVSYKPSLKAVAPAALGQSSNIIVRLEIPSISKKRILWMRKMKKTE